MNNLLVSVIIPIYNIELFVEKCIQSVIKQTYKNIEIILVNDGSIDKSKDICDTYASIDNRIKVIHKTNGGLISARKAGLKQANGDYILYVDGDDWIEPNFITYYLKAAIKYNADVVISSHMENLAGRVEILSNTITPGFYNKEDLISKVYPKMLYNGKFSQFGIFSYVWGKLYRKEILIQNQLNVNEKIFIGEDAACLYPTLIDANSLVILDKPFYHYRQRVDSLIKTQKKNEINKITIFYNYLKKIFKKKGYLDIMLPQLQFFILSLLTVRSEGPSIYNKLKQLYPFNKVKYNDHIVICGGGTFGQHLYKRLKNYKHHKIVTWIDEWCEHYSKLGLPVVGFNILNTLKYDVIIIALIDEDISNQTLLKLVDMGVDKNKIIQVSHYNKNNIEQLLLEYKIKL